MSIFPFLDFFFKKANQEAHIFTFIYKGENISLNKKSEKKEKERKRMGDQVLEYSIQLAMLRQLLSEKLINKQEYFKIKKLLMEKYNISSDLTC